MIKVTQDRVEDLIRSARDEWKKLHLNFDLDESLVCLSQGVIIAPVFRNGRVVPMFIINQDDKEAVSLLSDGWEKIKENVDA